MRRARRSSACARSARSSHSPRLAGPSAEDTARWINRQANREQSTTMVFSFEQPLRLRTFGMEMLRGASLMRPMLTSAKRRTGWAVAVIQHWIDQGLMDRVDPLLLLFNTWAITQFYAEHADQVSYYSERPALSRPQREAIIDQNIVFILRAAGVK